MINNNPYNIPEKKPLSQSKIQSQSNSSRYSSAYLQSKSNAQLMYSSGIFIKNSSTMNAQYEQNLFQPVKEHLYPHAKFTKPSNIQFVPPHNPVRHSQNYCLPSNIPKEDHIQRVLSEFKFKIDIIQKILQLQQRKETSLKQIQCRKTQSISEIDFSKNSIQDSLIHSKSMKDFINEAIQKKFQIQITKSQLKTKQYQIPKTDSSVNSRVSSLQESFCKFQNDKTFEQQMHLRIKSIEKTIREMGQDIHLINDKEQNLSQKISNQFLLINNQLMNFKINEKKLGGYQRSNEQTSEELNLVSKRLTLLESKIQLSLMAKIKQIQSYYQKTKNNYRDVKPSFQDRYLSEPIVLKYIQKFQVSNPQTQYLHMSPNINCDQILISQITYFIDNEGYLLDNDRFYLLTGTKSQRIKLDQKHIDVLRLNKMLI